MFIKEKIKLMKKLVILLLTLAAGQQGLAQGHYTGSSFNPNDYFAPHAGLIVPVWYGYANMDYHNAQGKKVRSIDQPKARQSHIVGYYTECEDAFFYSDGHLRR